MPIAWLLHHYAIGTLKYKYKTGQLPASAWSCYYWQAVDHTDTLLCCKMEAKLEDKDRMYIAKQGYM